MKKFLSLFFAISLTLSACGTVSTQPAPPAQTGTPTITSAATRTPTATITPLPTIPTFTPTFDASTIVTVTPAERAECPEETALRFSRNLIQELESWDTPKFIDVTNDDVEEIIIDGHRYEDGTGTVFIYSCLKGEYAVIDKIRAVEYPSPNIETIYDLNKNGIPEIIITMNYCGGWGSCWEVHILEWDGYKFVDLMERKLGQFDSSRLEEVSFEQTNKNVLGKIIIKYGLPSHPDSLLHGPWREFTTFYSWNGENYVMNSINFALPEYRFQAIQDGDYNSDIENYDIAISLYQEVISNTNLDWWSEERYFVQLQTDIWGLFPTPTPSAPDSAEYPSLAAYAYYRIILLHLVQGQEAEAASTYQTLQDTFGADPYAAHYVEMATAFWEAYQSTQKMYDGCAAAIQYAVEHPEILNPLGSDYHGWQSHIYVPADVCPFR